MWKSLAVIAALIFGIALLLMIGGCNLIGALIGTATIGLQKFVMLL